jgi:FkbM family methyltransferase
MYTQNGEHEIIVPFFNGIDPRDLSFLDIGANDGKSFSNTWGLTLLGWKGCCVEPSPSAFDKLSDNYKKYEGVHPFNFGISDQTGIFKFYESGNWVDNEAPVSILSSLHQSHQDNFYGMNWREIDCKFVTFDEFLNQSPIKKFDFISIDVEGHDFVVLNQINLKDVGCKLICLEHGGNMDTLDLFISYCGRYGMSEIHRNVDNILLGLNKNNNS